MQKEIQALANRGRAHDLQKFFQTAPGQYGEGDVFLGLTVPQVRAIAREYKGILLREIEVLIRSKFHEARLCGLVILTLQYKATKEGKEKKKLFDLYMRAMTGGYINNWDLVDVTAPIIGEYLIDTDDPYILLSKLATVSYTHLTLPTKRIV